MEVKPLSDRIFVGYKPRFISSNSYIQSCKKKFRLDKIGYSGTLDPFASGVVVIASGAYTKILPHLHLTPKIYIATLWLGVESRSLDIECINKVDIVPEVSGVCEVLHSMIGTLTYRPPIFSAKKINGIRAYKLARKEQEVVLDEIKTEIFDIALLHYAHPFLTFQISVQKGAYIRSIASIIASKLGTQGALSNLIRIQEGDFVFENYKNLNPIHLIKYPKIDLLAFKKDIEYGRKIIINDEKIEKNTRYIAIFDDFFSIIEFDNLGQIKYILNKVGL